MQDPVYRILYAEDEQYFMEPVVIRLRAEGYFVKVVSTATEALDALEAEEWHLVLLDVMMQAGDRIRDTTFGRQSGAELCRVIREDLKLDIPIVCLTVVTDNGIQNSLLSQGATILVKPSLQRDIIHEISRALRRHYERTSPDADSS